MTKWVRYAGKLAANLRTTTPGGQNLVRRILNKTKHGLLVSAIWQDGGPLLIFHPEAGNALPNQETVQRVTTENAAYFATQTYGVSKLLAVTLLQFLAFEFKREADVSWKRAIEAGADEMTFDGVAGIVAGQALPRSRRDSSA
ncbi:MAG: hypothetical protein EXR63_05240 [Dehalococcoidia bacterium]|nr:hypothetical protein [Dehalococcoidia bacterium]